MYNCNSNTNTCPNVSITLAQNAETLAPCNLITYTVVINNEDPNVSYGYFKDILPAPIVFLPGSVTVNGVNMPTLNPETGFNVNFLTLGNTVTITYTGKAYGDNCCCVKVSTCDCCRQFRTLCNKATFCYRQCCQTKTITSQSLPVAVEY